MDNIKLLAEAIAKATTIIVIAFVIGTNINLTF
jgi:hypothetical protein